MVAGGGMHGCSKGGCAWLLWGRGHVWFATGGVHGCSWGGMRGSSGGHVWLLQGACVVAPGGACVVAPGGGMHGCSQRWGVCMVAPGWAYVVALGGVHGCPGGAWVVARGHAWLLWGGGHAWDTTRYGDTVNERAVRILLECILVK